MIRQTPCEMLLGLSGEYTVDDVQSAFRRLAVTGHADHGGSIDMAVLRKARDQANIVAANRDALTDCVKCGGKGFTRGTGFAPAKCTKCQGTGKVRRD